MNCPNCGKSLPDRGVFCPACGQQAKCKNCRELLEPSAVACVECGECVDGDHTILPQHLTQLAEAPNVMRLEETRTSRSFEARFTDTAVENLSGPLAAYLSGGFLVTQKKRGRSQYLGDSGSNTHQLELPPIENDNYIDVPLAAPRASFPASVHPAEPKGDEERLHDIFSYADGRLRLKDPRTKANTKIEYVGRLTCLFLYAHELDGRPNIQRSALNSFLSEAKLLDGNSRTWLAKTQDLLIDGELIELSVLGRERAIETLRRNEDPAVVGTFVLGSPTKSRAVKLAPGSDGVAQEGASRPVKRKVVVESKKIAPWVEQWRAAGISVNANEVLRGKPNAEKGVFGLWAIRCAMADDGKVVTSLQLAKFLYQAFEIMINEATLRKALKSRTMKDLVINIGGTRFQITPDGMSFVERMAGLRDGKPAPTTTLTNDSSPVTA